MNAKEKTSNITPQHKAGRKKTILLVGVLALIVGVLCVVGVAGKHQADIATMFRKSTTREPEHFTELYFSEPQNLVKTYGPGDKVPFNFAIHNLEGRDIVYRYRVYADDQSQATSTEVRVASKELKFVSSDVLIAGPGPRVKVTIELIDQRQSIHFWVERD